MDGDEERRVVRRLRFSKDEDGERGTFFVPETSGGFVIHDQHEDEVLKLGSGVYEFRFLDGHEDEW